MLCFFFLVIAIYQISNLAWLKLTSATSVHY